VEKPLWAPWRMELIASEKPAGCIFCEFPSQPEQNDRKNLVVHRTRHAFVCLNKYPYTSGHVMVIPRAHGAQLSALPPDAFADLNDTLRRTVEVIRASYRPDGMNLGMNLVRAGGAGVLDHLHWHVVPRWSGDNNFMPVLADTRVIIEHLDAAWEKVREGFRAG
jgi:ATP adenylyltransferase